MKFLKNRGKGQRRETLSRSKSKEKDADQSGLKKSWEHPKF